MNLKFLHYFSFQKYKFYDVIAEYSLLDEAGRSDLSERHRAKSKAFNMESCADNFVVAFEDAPAIKKSSAIFFSFMLRFAICEVWASITSGEKYSKKYEHVL